MEKTCVYQLVVNEESNALQGDLSLEEAKFVFGDSFAWPAAG